MNNIEIKKALYKQKPKAEFCYIKNEIATYKVSILNENKDIPTMVLITFEIPVNDMGDAHFYPTMDAKLLNRWIMVEEEV